MYKVLDSIWFGIIGIVAIDSNGFGWKCYIGTGIGLDKGEDEQKIAKTGMSVGKTIAHATFPNLPQDKFRS